MDLLEKAMKGAWNILSEADKIPDTPANRKLLASCVVDEAIAGKIKYNELVNGAVARFREKRAGAC